MLTRKAKVNAMASEIIGRIKVLDEKKFHRRMRWVQTILSTTALIFAIAALLIISKLG